MWKKKEISKEREWNTLITHIVVLLTGNLRMVTSSLAIAVLARGRLKTRKLMVTAKVIVTVNSLSALLLTSFTIRTSG